MAALPNTGITTSMVAQALGAATNDVGTLCKHPNVNKWSKWKPIRKAKVTGITFSDLQDANFGLTALTHANSPMLLKQAIENSGSGLDYLKPLGGSSSPYRLGDFRNYLHNALIPTGTSVKSDETVVVKKGSAYHENLDYYMYYEGITVPESDTNICLQDLYPEPRYKGILLINGSTSVWKTGRVNWNELPIKNWEGETIALQFYTNVEQPTLRDGDSVDGGSIFYALPIDDNNINPYILDVTNEYADGSIPYIVSISAVLSLTIITYTVVFDASISAASGKYCTDVAFHIFDGTNVVNTVHPDDFDLQKGQTKTFTGTITVPDPDGNYYFRVYEGQQLRKQVVVMKQSI